MSVPPGDDDRDKFQSSQDERSDLQKRLSELDSKLSKVRPVKDAENESQAPKGLMSSYAFRIASEFIAGPLVGGFLGWWLDKWLGTYPFLLLILFTFGLAAGFINVLKTAKQMQELRAKEDKQDS